MRILVISQYFWPENFRINDLVQEWRDRGYEVTVLTGVPNYPSGQILADYQVNPAGFSEFHGAEIVRVPMLPRHTGAFRLMLNYFSFMISASLLGVWRLRRKKFDVVFVFEPSPITVGIPAVIFRFFKKVPVVFWVLDLWPETLSAIGVVKSKFALHLVGKLVSFIYNRCDMVLGQSKSFSRSIAQYCCDKQKIRYFPSWPEDVFTSAAGLTPAVEIAQSDDTFTIVFAGNVGEAQDFPAILRAAELLKTQSIKVRWCIVGDGRMSSWLYDQVMQRGLDGYVQILGRFPVERMPSFYLCADALLVSLKSDPVFALTIPGKVQSYLMSGIPLLGMLDGEGANVIRDANAGLCAAAGDAQGLADAIIEMSKMDLAERKRLGQNGRIYAQAQFGRRKLIDTLDSWFMEVIDKKTGKNYVVDNGI